MAETTGLAPAAQVEHLVKAAFATRWSPALGGASAPPAGVEFHGLSIDAGFGVQRQLRQLERAYECSAEWHRVLTTPPSAGQAEEIEGGLCLLVAMRSGRTPGAVRQEVGAELDALAGAARLAHQANDKEAAVQSMPERERWLRSINHVLFRAAATRFSLAPAEQWYRPGRNRHGVHLKPLGLFLCTSLPCIWSMLSAFLLS